MIKVRYMKLKFPLTRAYIRVYLGEKGKQYMLEDGQYEEGDLDNVLGMHSARGIGSWIYISGYDPEDGSVMFNTLVHECLHAALHLWQSVGSNLTITDDGQEEVIAYTQGWLVDEVMTAISTYYKLESA